MPNFLKYLQEAGQSLIREATRCVQINVGYRCNLECSHCHIEAGPKREEMMSWPVMEDILAFIERAGVQEVDITGGAPEMNPHLPELLGRIRTIQSVERILLRSNLAILDEAEYAELPRVFAKYDVEIIASMPCYLEENLDTQRGKGVHMRNIHILQELNLFGYGTETSNLKLHLVYNPLSNFLPCQQAELEQTYKEYLWSEFSILFNKLYTITNMPIGRFRIDLEKQGLFDDYMKLLADHFNIANLSKVMCRGLISVDWEGRVYDCDFNQVLKLSNRTGDGFIGQIDPQSLAGSPIAIANHCFACVAGAGSSCQGSLKNTVVE